MSSIEFTLGWLRSHDHVTQHIRYPPSARIRSKTIIVPGKILQ